MPGGEQAAAAPEQHAPRQVPLAGALVRIVAGIYESLILVAVLFLADLALLLAVAPARDPAFRPLVQVYLVSVIGCYFVWFWTHGGQTLAMKTWRLQVVSAAGRPLTARQALARYLVAVVTLVVPSFLWALVDRDRQFLHDRIAGTRVVRHEKAPAPER